MSAIDLAITYLMNLINMPALTFEIFNMLNCHLFIAIRHNKKQFF